MKTLSLKTFASLFIYTMLMVIFLVVPSDFNGLQAQDDKVNEVGNRAKRKTERRVDNTINDAIDDGLDAIFKKNKKKKKDKEDDFDFDDEDTYDGSSSDNYEVVSVEDITYNQFTGSFTMDLTTTTSGRTNPDQSGTVNYFFDRQKSAFQVNANGKPTTMIFDLPEQKVTTITQKDDGTKLAIISNRQPVKINQSRGSAEVTRLSSTRNIDGKTCNKYLVDTDEELITMWVAESLAADFKSLMLSVQSQGSKDGKLAGDYLNQIDGFPLDITIESKVKDERTHARVSNLKVGSVSQSVFSTAGAEVIDTTNY